ncbi:hypothetical protein L1987_00382 [Smallanthus sonchifolius]|uniref:Uncharacterized protein n=1 Tax=Smallanthus sonchifolius TaxID=185202 RepID=A0ACB9K200_9ASTR|nr:hypothetical protein L1987_00382 [Smallanthus sonchifolius]
MVAQAAMTNTSSTFFGAVVVIDDPLTNGSTLSILGANSIFSKVREMPIVGGSGLFRFARGYAFAKTYSFNTTSGDAVVEYDVYVLHY